MKGKVHFIQLGCDKNRVDGEVMLGLLDRAGYGIVSEPEEADAIIVNTCGFIREAVQESIETALEAAEHKTAGGCKALIIAGCMATRYKDEILRDIPEADAAVAASEYGTIADVLDGILFGSNAPGEENATNTNSADALDAPTDGKTDFCTQWSALRLAGRKMTSARHVAFVKISEGCDNRCTYCAIPSIRGAYVERTFESIVDECKQLIADGAKELVFVAQDTAKHSRIADLLREVSKLDGLTWLRLMYAYPEHITAGLIDAMASGEKICRYIDMPIQHAGDSVLKRMGRKSTRAELTGIINKLREKIPGIVIRTTLMVGFPGETEAEFNALCDFARDIRFDRLGVFVYSPEDGTPAARMKGKVKKAEANARRDKLMLIQREIHGEKQRALIGETAEVMVDTVEAGGAYVTVTGRTFRDAAEVDASVILKAPASAALMPGQIIKARLTGYDDYDLQGEIL